MPAASRPLQNRVTPFGEIVAIPERGGFTGNRGIIHDPATRTLLPRRWTSKAWIVCLFAFRDVRRDVMSRRSGTELFSLDAATRPEERRVGQGGVSTFKSGGC